MRFLPEEVRTDKSQVFIFRKERGLPNQIPNLDSSFITNPHEAIFKEQ